MNKGHCNIYLQSECIEKYQFQLCPKYDREHNIQENPKLGLPIIQIRTFSTLIFENDFNYMTDFY